MKISDIDAFAAVVRCQTLSRRSRAGMTQPAITRRVQNLEEALGVTLLDRNTKPPRPTDIGRRVFEQCRAILREVDAARADGRRAAACRRIPDRATQGLGELMLPALIAELAAQWPALATQVTTAWGGMLVERVARRELDAALVFLAREMVLPAQVEGERLLATRLVAVGRRATGRAAATGSPIATRVAGCSIRTAAVFVRACGARSTRRACRCRSRSTPTAATCAERRERLRYRTDAAAARRSSPLRDALDIVPLADFKPQIDQAAAPARCGPLRRAARRRCRACAHRVRVAGAGARQGCLTGSGGVAIVGIAPPDWRPRQPRSHHASLRPRSVSLTGAPLVSVSPFAARFTSFRLAASSAARPPPPRSHRPAAYARGCTARRDSDVRADWRGSTRDCRQLQRLLDHADRVLGHGPLDGPLVVTVGAWPASVRAT